MRGAPRRAIAANDVLGAEGVREAVGTGGFGIAARSRTGADGGESSRDPEQGDGDRGARGEDRVMAGADADLRRHARAQLVLQSARAGDARYERRGSLR